LRSPGGFCNRTPLSASAVRCRSQLIHIPGRLVRFFLILSFIGLPKTGFPEDVHVAVAANFLPAAEEIGTAFEADTGHTVLFSFGATGQLYAQIVHGAPFDVFLAADGDRPQKAVDRGLAVAGSRFTYAEGRLALYSRQAHLVAGQATLFQGHFSRLAIANPKTAPFGAAAIEVMDNLGVSALLAPKLVQGTNIMQAYQFIATRNAELGFVAYSQIIFDESGSRWLVPETLHAPIAQDAVLLENGRANTAANAFAGYLKSPRARVIINRYGYGVPAHAH